MATERYLTEQSFMIRAIIGGLALVLLGFIAELYIAVNGIPTYMFPKPSLLITSFPKNAQALFSSSIATLRIFIMGFALGTFVGIIFGVLLYYLPIFRRAILPIIIAFRSAPVFAFVALYIIWFGFDDIPKLLITAQVCFLPVFLNTLEGLDSVKSEFVLLLRSLNASRWEILYKVRFPSALSIVLTGLRTTLIFALVGTVISEWVIANSGLGRLIQHAARGFDTVMTFHIIVTIGFIGLIMFGIVVLLETLILRKYKS